MILTCHLAKLKKIRKEWKTKKKKEAARKAEEERQRAAAAAEQSRAAHKAPNALTVYGEIRSMAG